MKILNRSTVVFTLVMLMFTFSTVQEARAQGGPLRIMTSKLPDGAVNTPYTFTADGAGGTGSYTWTASGLPAGLSIGSTGQIAGTPTTSCNCSVTLTLKDVTLTTVTKTLTLNIYAPLAITTTSLPSGTAGAAYSQALTATGGNSTYSWSLSSGSLPAGLTLSATGVISGPSTTVGTSNFTVRVDSGSLTVTKALSITIVSSVPLSITTTSPLTAGMVGAPYSQTLAATGGATPYAWTLASGSLPGGLTLSGAGAISGTPTTAGIFNFTIQVAGGQTASAGFAITIDPAPAALSITTTSPLSPGVVTAPYSQTLIATGGTAPYTWLVTAGALPPGLTLSAGTISGSPTTAGSFNFTVQITDNATRTASKPFSLTINPALSITTASPLPAGVVEISYSQTLAATGGATPYAWTLASGSLPAGLTLSGAGVIGGMPTTAGIFNFTIQVAGGSQTASAGFSITIDPAPAALSITTTSPLSPGVVAAPYSQTLTATGGTAPYTWLVTAGALPPGLTLLATGTISGSPTTAGSFNFTVQITDTATRTASKPFSLTINPALSIITASPLSAGVVEISYSQTLAATGGATPYAWTLASGSLPAGLNLSGAGAISGTPTTAGIFNFTIQVAGGSQTASAVFSITIDPAPAALSINTTSPLSPGVVAAPYSQTLTATGGTAPYTWLVTAGALPPGLTLLATGTISGSPTTAGSFNFTVQITDTATRTASKPFSLTINPAFSITTASPLQNGVVSNSYSQTLAAAGGTTPYTWLVISGSLPEGLTLSAAGVVSGAPATVGSFTFTAQVADSVGLKTSTAFSITIDPQQLSITTASPLATAVISASFSQTLTAAGGTTPYTWSVISGALPTGLTLSATGSIGGTPTAAGAFSFTVEVVDSSPSPQRISKAYSIQIVTLLTINSNPLISGYIGIGYGQTLTATGGSLPYSWSLTSGSLPPGITLSSSGELSGTPTTSGVSSFTVRVTDSATTPQASVQAFTIVVVTPLAITSPTALNNASTDSTYSVALTALGGTLPYSWSVISGQLPPGLSLSSSGILSGTPTIAGVFTFLIQVNDATGIPISKSFSLTVQTGLIITTVSPLTGAVIDSFYSMQVQASFPEPLMWSLVSGNLPSGLDLSSSGLISGIPTSVGAYEFTIQVAGGAPPQTATQIFALRVSSGLLITTNSTLPDGTSSAAYIASLSVTGGVGPYGWTQAGGSMPDGLSLSNSGLISGTPTRAGIFTFTVQVSDSSSLKATKTLTVSIVPPAVGSFSLTGVPATVNPTQQMPVGLLLSAPQPTPLAGSLIMTFTSSSAVPADDPVVQFSTGSRAVNFTIPAGSTTAVFPTPVLLLTGTVSGTVVLTANIQDGPTSVPVQSVVIQPTVPQMTNVAAVRTTNGLRVQVTGYSPGRRVINAEFGFDLKAAAGGQRVNLSRSVESEFDGWYRSSASSAFGSSFSFEQLFRVQGDPNMIESVTITFTNEVGSATSIRAQIP